MSPQSMGHSQNDDIVAGHTLQFRSHCQTTTHPQVKMMTSAKLVPCSVAAINYVNEVALYPVKQWANIGENPFCGNATIEHSRQDTTRRGTNQNPPRLLTFKFCRIFLNLVPVGPQGTWCSYGISSNNEHHDVEEHHGVSWVRALGCFFSELSELSEFRFVVLTLWHFETLVIACSPFLALLRIQVSQK